MSDDRSNPPKCSAPELKDLFFLFVNLDVTAEERQRIEEHLSTCADCRRDVLLFLDLRKAWVEKRHWSNPL
jgi:Putative zinc-finger